MLFPTVCKKYHPKTHSHIIEIHKNTGTEQRDVIKIKTEKYYHNSTYCAKAVNTIGIVAAKKNSKRYLNDHKIFC
jgi:hypothetical protein